MATVVAIPSPLRRDTVLTGMVLAKNSVDLPWCDVMYCVVVGCIALRSVVLCSAALCFNPPHNNIPDRYSHARNFTGKCPGQAVTNDRGATHATALESSRVVYDLSWGQSHLCCGVRVALSFLFTSRAHRTAHNQWKHAQAHKTPVTQYRRVARVLSSWQWRPAQATYSLPIRDG